MKNRVISKEQRTKFFDFVSRATQGQQIELEVAGLDIGDQIEEDWVQLLGITYDHQDEALYIDTPAFEHAIPNPVDIISVQDDFSVGAIYIKDDEGHVQSLKFRTPLLLQAPEARA